MTCPAAFSATYSDFKLVKTRKVAQLVFEVPLEAVDAALAVVGGMPDPSAERWFGIAPLREEAVKAKTDWSDMPPASQAFLRCQDIVFRKFLAETHGLKVSTEDDAAVTVRELCGVQSRSELSVKHAARVAWHQIDAEFQAWKAA